MVVERVLRSRPVRDYGLMTLGIALTAWALDAFLIPNRIAAGGVSGLATIIYHTAQDLIGATVSIGVQMLVMNAILLFVAWRARGLGYIAKTVYGIVALSVFIDVFAGFTTPLATDDLLLAALYGGAVSGLGMGLVFKAGGNTGGTDIIGQLLSRRLPFGVGQIMLVVDAAVTALAAFAFGPKLALYGVVAIFVGSATIDLVLEGIAVDKAVWIISDAADRIGASVNAEMDRGATAMEATGVFTGQKRGMLFVVVSRNELDDLKAIVREIDPNAMVVISDVHETIGEGFKGMGA